MSAMVRVKKETLNALKAYLDEPYNFSSLNEAIRFLMEKETLFELLLNAKPELLTLVDEVQRKEKIRRLEEKLRALKENRPPRPTTTYKVHITDVDLEE